MRAAYEKAHPLVLPDDHSSRARPYSDAPRLPGTHGRVLRMSDAADEEVDVRTLVKGEWIELEIGPGRGGFLLERAAAEPRAGLVGLEVRRKWATLVDGRLARAGFGARARVFAEDARIALPRLVPDRSIRRVFLHFPDPWWKKRHQKRLVVQPELLDSIARLLEPHGELYVQTDVEERAESYERAIAGDARFAPAGDAPGSPRMAENPYGARSPREHRAIADGLPVHRMRFTRSVSQ